jgi:uncharacterized protein (TIGR00159 family)
VEWLVGRLDFLLDIVKLIRWGDAFDILIVTLIIYKLLTLIKGTRTAQIILGILVLFVFYWTAGQLEIRTLHAILSYFFNNLFILLALIFQQEIRRALSRVGQTPLLASLGGGQEGQTLEEIVKSVISLANRKIGALIVLENTADVLDFVEQGTLVDAHLDRDLLTSLFMPVSPLHDGAVIIRKGRIHRAGCFLPLTLNPSLSKAVGTRHRAAVGITEETDAVCVVVSEENGAISVASDGKIVHHLDASQLRKTIVDALKGRS